MDFRLGLRYRESSSLELRPMNSPLSRHKHVMFWGTLEALALKCEGLKVKRSGDDEWSALIAGEELDLTLQVFYCAVNKFFSTNPYSTYKCNT